MTTADVDKIRAEAKVWLSLINSGNASKNDFAGFNAWLVARPEHRTEYRRLESLWLELDDVREIALAKYGQEVKKRPVQHSLFQSFVSVVTFSRFPLTKVTMAALTGAAITIAVYLPSKTAITEDQLNSSLSTFDSNLLTSKLYSSGTGEIITIELPDGSITELGPQSSLEVDFSRYSRNSRVLWGEAYFKVAKDHYRPFLVVSGNGTVRATGTEFEIRKGVREVSVTVHQGRVEISTRSDKTNQTVDSASLTATEQVSYAVSGPMSTIRNIDLSTQSGWRSGRMIFNHQPLLEVVADLNRYGTTHIIIADERLFDIKVNGIFKMGESEAVLRAIEKTLPAKVVRNKSNKVTLLYAEPR